MTNQPRNKERLTKWPEPEPKLTSNRQRILRLEKQGIFPKRIKISVRKVAWDYWEIVNWIEQLKLACAQSKLSDHIRSHAPSFVRRRPWL